MNFLSKLFSPRSSADLSAQNAATIDAKEKQSFFIRNTLKPLLKKEGYRTIGNKWWKINEPFFNLIELQNFSWNTQASVDFCFNFTTGFMKDIKRPDRPSIHDGITYIRESYFELEKNHYWTGANGYHIDEGIDLGKFSEQILNDFKLSILPKVNLLTDKGAIIRFYADELWGPIVRQNLEIGCRNMIIDS